MHERKSEMAKNADAFIALPGESISAISSKLSRNHLGRWKTKKKKKLTLNICIPRRLRNHGGTPRGHCLVSARIPWQTSECSPHISLFMFWNNVLLCTTSMRYSWTGGDPERGRVLRQLARTIRERSGAWVHRGVRQAHCRVSRERRRADQEDGSRCGWKGEGEGHKQEEEKEQLIMFSNVALVGSNWGCLLLALLSGRQWVIVRVEEQRMACCKHLLLTVVCATSMRENRKRKREGGGLQCTMAKQAKEVDQYSRVCCCKCPS